MRRSPGRHRSAWHWMLFSWNRRLRVTVAVSVLIGTMAWSAAVAGSAGAAVVAPPPPSSTLRGVSCVDATHCFAVGYTTTNGSSHNPIILATTDSSNWVSQTVPSGLGGGILTAVSCVDTTHCFAVGAPNVFGAAIVATTDGSTWVSQTVPSGLGEFGGVSCVNTTHCFVVGTTSSFAGAIVATTDGSTWVSQTVPSGLGVLGGVSCVDASNCFAV